jgi:type VI secretion system secreted protein VgrG
MPKGYFIRKFDKTSCGGMVLDATSGMGWHDQDHASEFDPVSCGVDGKTYWIAGGIPFMRSDDRCVAGTLHSYSACPCQAQLYHSLDAASYSYDGDDEVAVAASPSSRSAVPVPVPTFAPTATYAAPPAEDEIEEEEEEVEVEQLITLRIGMFFDGTGNNRENSELAYGCFARAVGLQDAGEDIRRFCAAQGYDGQGGAPDDSRGNDTSNVARLYDLYVDESEVQLADEIAEASIRVYVEGIGTSSTGSDSWFSQGTGRGAQGVRARVEESPRLLLKVLTTFQENNPDKRVQKIEFDIFGFSRGAAAARDFLNEVLKARGSFLAKALPTGSPGFSDTFAWRHHYDFSINYLGIYDTVASISAPLRWDWSGNNADNAGIDTRIPRGAAKKVVHLVAGDEHRFNFALNKADDPDIILPGAHSDLGGGYRPDVTERVLLSKPHHSDVHGLTPSTSAPSYKLAQADLLRLQRKYAKYDLSLSLLTWEVDTSTRAKGDLIQSKRVYAVVSSERKVQSDLSLVYLRIMRELAVKHGVPFEEIDPDNARLALPNALVPVYSKLLAYAQGKTRTYGLTRDEELLMYRRYVHLSAHWNPVKDWKHSDLDVVFINRPDADDLRTEHPNE